MHKSIFLPPYSNLSEGFTKGFYGEFVEILQWVHLEAVAHILQLHQGYDCPHYYRRDHAMSLRD